MRPFLRIALVLVLCATLTAAPAIACCDDFWSCAEAVATAGLSCAVEAAINALRALIANVRSVRDQHSQEFEKGLVEIQRECDALKAKLALLAAKTKADMDKIQKEADSIVGEDAARLTTYISEKQPNLQTTFATPTPAVGGARLDKSKVLSRTPTPTPKAVGAGSSPLGASHGTGLVSASKQSLVTLTPDAHETMKDLRNEIADLHKKTAELMKQIIAKQAQAEGLQVAAAEQARKVFAGSFLTRVENLLGSLERALSHPFDIGNLVSASASLLDGLISGYDRDVPPAVDRAGADMWAAAGLPAPPAYQAAALARQAAAILDKMRRAQVPRQSSRAPRAFHERLGRACGRNPSGGAALPRGDLSHRSLQEDEAAPSSRSAPVSIRFGQRPSRSSTSFRFGRASDPSWMECSAGSLKPTGGRSATSFIAEARGARFGSEDAPGARDLLHDGSPGARRQLTRYRRRNRSFLEEES